MSNRGFITISVFLILSIVLNILMFFSLELNKLNAIWKENIETFLLDLNYYNKLKKEIIDKRKFINNIYSRIIYNTFRLTKETGNAYENVQTLSECKRKYLYRKVYGKSIYEVKFNLKPRFIKKNNINYYNSKNIIEDIKETFDIYNNNSRICNAFMDNNINFFLGDINDLKNKFDLKKELNGVFIIKGDLYDIDELSIKGILVLNCDTINCRNKIKLNGSLFLLKSKGINDFKDKISYKYSKDIEKKLSGILLDLYYVDCLNIKVY